MPLARLGVSTGVPGRGSGRGRRLLLLQQETWMVAWLRDSMVVPEEGSRVLLLQRYNRTMA